MGLCHLKGWRAFLLRPKVSVARKRAHRPVVTARRPALALVRVIVPFIGGPTIAAAGPAGKLIVAPLPFPVVRLPLLLRIRLAVLA